MVSDRGKQLQKNVCYSHRTVKHQLLEPTSLLEHCIIFLGPFSDDSPPNLQDILGGGGGYR